MISVSALTTPKTATDQAAEAQHEKRFATLRAQLALHGFQLRASPFGGLLITQWNLCRELPDLDAVEAWTSKLGGPA